MRFGRIPTGLGAAVGAVVYTATVVAVLVGGLTLWSRFHLSLRSFGHPAVMFCLLFLVLGAIAFPLSAYVAHRLMANLARARLHFATAGFLYYYSITATVLMIQRLPRAGLEERAIALEASLLVAAYGIVLNALVVWFAGHKARASPPKEPHARSAA